MAGVLAGTNQLYAQPLPAPDLRVIELPGACPFEPTGDLLRRAWKLRELDATRLQETGKTIQDKEGAACRIVVGRAGIRLQDTRAARAAAQLLEWDELDPAEIERVIQLGLEQNEYARPGTVVDFEKLRSMIGSQELDRIFGNFPAPPWNESATYYIAQLHRQCRAEHIPVLLALARRPEKEVRETALGNIGVIRCRTDRFVREEARDILKQYGVSIPARSGGGKAAGREHRGYPPELTALLETFWTRKESPEGWETRWVERRVPGPADAPLLQKLAALWFERDEDEQVLVSLIRALRHGPGPETRELLARISKEAESQSTRVLAAASLAQLGDPEQRAWLVRRSEKDSLALALYLELDPAAAVKDLRARIFERGREAARACLACLEDMDQPEPPFHIQRDEAAIWSGFEDAAIRSRAHGLTLLDLMHVVPGCRTPALAEETLKRLDAAALRTELARLRADEHGEGLGRLREKLAGLEVAAPGAFRKSLRAWLGDPDRAVRTLARRVLLVIGDPASGPALVDWVRSGRTDEDVWRDLPGFCIADDKDAAYLARSPGPEVQAYLRAIARAVGGRVRSPEEDSGAREALAILAGLPEWTASAVLSTRSDDPAVQERARGRGRMVTEGRALEALQDYLAHATSVPLDLWKVDTPAVRAFLGRMQREREHRSYAMATAELAALGDPEARRQTAAMLRAGRYRWVDELAECADLATLGYDLKTWVPFWIRELESSCCRCCNATCVLEVITDYDIVVTHDEHPGETPADRMRRWWSVRKNARFVLSRLTGYFLAVW